MSQDLYVIRNSNRNLILGLDWLNQNNVRIYFDFKCLRINGKHYVNFKEDIHFACQNKNDMLNQTSNCYVMLW